MAAMPAYRYDYAGSAQPARREREVPQSPQIHVVRGRKTSTNPAISDRAVFAVRVVVFFLVLALIVGFARVGIAAAAYTTASQASELRSEISIERQAGSGLVIQESALVFTGKENSFIFPYSELNDFNIMQDRRKKAYFTVLCSGRMVEGQILEPKEIDPFVAELKEKMDGTINIEVRK